MVQGERLWGLTAVPGGIAGGTGAVEVLVFTARQFTTHAPAPALPRLECVTCRFIFLSIKAPLQAHRVSWRCGEGEGVGKPKERHEMKE